ncbi:MAG: response regulator [Actinomycetota bacterium]
MTGPIRVVVADDQHLVRLGLRAVLEREPDVRVVGEASDGAAAAREAVATAADVVLMDVEMPGVDGIGGVRLVLEQRPQARVLMLTMFDLDEYVFEALRAGASGFLIKTATPAELAGAIRAVHSGEMLFAPSVVRRLVGAYVRQPPPGDAVPARVAALTERELEVLRILARGHSNAEIGRALFMAEATVKTHITRILAKLGLRDRVQAVVLAYETGLVRPE